MDDQRCKYRPSDMNFCALVAQVLCALGLSQGLACRIPVDSSYQPHVCRKRSEIVRGTCHHTNTPTNDPYEPPVL
ncbi:hypothetical protein B0I35DRAFT_435579 [Stachybotrys elegans]|uniref:Secreted protein n=1 Tax=Stachybotrys elegans TaxID=80388 RepID=A0A8K0WR02_9HYPO|nr:hypothetical protein B0I35DRAFT_435579 [Stachybotrys elegans]